MKKYFLMVNILLIVTLFCFGIPSDAQIRKCADELGVPFNELKQFLEKVSSESTNKRGRYGFISQYAEKAEIVTVDEVIFKVDTKQIKAGSYVIISPAAFFRQEGTKLFVSTPGITGNKIRVTTNTLYNFQIDTKIAILVKYNGSGSDWGYDLIELIRQ
jgi:hypothetical protein